MNDKYLSQTELGQLYDVTSHKMGKWLVALGLRTHEKKPSSKAFQGGFVTRRDSTQPGTYFWVWHGEKTILALDAAGHKRTAQAEQASN